LEELHVVLWLRDVAVYPVGRIEIANVVVPGDIANADGVVGGGQGCGALYDGLLLQGPEVVLGPIELQFQILDAGAGCIIGSGDTGLKLLDGGVDGCEVTLDLLDTYENGRQVVL
jgi:hypothetical protein